MCDRTGAGVSVGGVCFDLIATEGEVVFHEGAVQIAVFIDNQGDCGNFLSGPRWRTVGNITALFYE